jgi:hypothetical protein
VRLQLVHPHLCTAAPNAPKKGRKLLGNGDTDVYSGRSFREAVLASAQAGQGSSIVNARTFLGGSCGVAGGAIAFTLAGLVGVLTMIALAGLIGAALSRGISETA